MKNKKTKGFSLAELLLSLLIISIVLSAAIPTITKRMSGNREYIWRWAGENNNAYFGVGANQSAIIGYNAIPININNDGNEISDIITQNIRATVNGSEDDLNNDLPSDYPIGNVLLNTLTYSNHGDKLILLKKTVQNNNSNFLNSHISFYTMQNNASATTNDIEYAGRLTMDPGNIALGIASLQSINEDNEGENTALGHYTLTRNKGGIRNTAIGQKALSYNTNSSYNTAIGFGALYKWGEGSCKSNANGDVTCDTTNGNTSVGSTKGNNTVVGALALNKSYYNTYNNTVVGSQALSNTASAKDNVVIGYRALFNSGDTDAKIYNTIIGSQACNQLTGNNYGNVCIGYSVGNQTAATNDRYGLYIGTGLGESYDVSDISDRSAVVPLISGHTRYTETDNSTTYNKELVVNARKVEFRPYDGSVPIFEFNTLVGATDNGYAENGSNVGQFGNLLFNFRDTQDSGNDKTSISLFMDGINDTTQNPTRQKYMRIFAYDPYEITDISNSTVSLTNNPYADIVLNNMLLIDFPPIRGTDTASGTDSKKVEITTSDNVPLQVGTLFTQPSSTTPYLALYPGQFSIYNSQDTSTDININLKNSSDVGIDADSTTGDFYLKGWQNIVMYTSSGSVSIKDGEVYLTDITKGSDTGVASNINNLYSKIQELQQSQAGTSDARLKNISGDSTAGLDEINALEVKNYTFKNDKEKTPHVGVIAQQLQKIFPNSVFEGEDGYLRIKTEEIFYAMVNSVKELFTKIQDLAAQITGLDKRITELENQNKALTEQNKAFEKRLEKLEKQAAKTK